MFIKRALLWFWETTVVRWIVEIAIVGLFEAYAAPYVAERYPNIGNSSYAFAMVLAGIFAVTEIIAAYTKRIKSELNAILNNGALFRIEETLHTIDGHNKILQYVILKARFSEINPRGAQYFGQYFQKALIQIRDIIKGKFVMELNNAEDAWSSHIYSLNHASNGIHFYATCVVPRDEEGIRSVFENSVFRNYCDLSYKNTAAGRISSMKKIFIVQDELIASRAVCFKDHLRDIRSASKEIGNDACGNPKLEVKIICMSELHGSWDLKSIIYDFMLWGDELLVTSHLNSRYLLMGLDCSTDHHDIAHATAAFQRMFVEAQPIEHAI